MNNPIPSRPEFLEAATRVGARLCRDALWAGDRCNWLGDAMEFAGNAWTVAHRTFGPDLYSGTSGISLFLGRLYEFTGERAFLRTAEAALRQAWSRRETVADPMRFSFYSGWLGMAWARASLGEILHREDWVQEALSLVDALIRCETSPQLLDVISGSAGAIPALLHFHRRYQRAPCLDLARLHAENLLQTARRSDAGWSWQTLNSPCHADLTGFSHGAAGIGWALLEAAHAFNDPRFHHAGCEALRYERRWFDAAQQNWLDLRVMEAGPVAASPPSTCALAWCHGAPGIALSRLRAFELLGRTEIRNEAEIALHTTARAVAAAGQPGVGNFSLCHGHAGNAEALLYGAEVLSPGWRPLAEEAGRHLAERILKSDAPLPCGVPNGGETPGLMLGKAGMGYFLLRLVEPSRVPSPMMLVPAACRNVPPKSPSTGRPGVAVDRVESGDRDGAASFGREREPAEAR